MKKKIKLVITGWLILMSVGFFAQSGGTASSTGLPGDNLDLAAVLGIFKQSQNVEDFEKKLNAADTKVNNLDLNHDGKVDYLRVTDHGKNNFHSLVIQDPISSSESQDVAVIEVDKKGDKKAHVQIVGDEDLYGKNYIIRPDDKPEKTAATAATNDTGPVDDVYAAPAPSSAPLFVNVWGWPCVTYMYSPDYVFWISPWYWGYYPSWWYPWAPYGWGYYHTCMLGFYGGFYGGFYWHRSYINYMPRGRRIYAPHYTYSTYVRKTTNTNNNVVNSPRSNGNGGRNFDPTPKHVASSNNPGPKIQGNFGGKQQQPVQVMPRQATFRGSFNYQNWHNAGGGGNIMRGGGGGGGNPRGGGRR
ncbi:MAG TPA: hypothetical protein VNY73_04935 [Bacteroidia bacterium]|nr:hypothetical protein [Bacteroidia bacterium]